MNHRAIILAANQVDCKELALLPHVMIHDGEQYSYGLVVSQSERRRIDAGQIIKS